MKGGKVMAAAGKWNGAMHYGQLSDGHPITVLATYGRHKVL